MIILFGMAGSGKGTQGEILAETFDWRWISVGDVIRQKKEYADIINKGELIPDEDVVKMMSEEISESLKKGTNVILDGFPRDELQAEYVAEHYAKDVEVAVVLEVPKEELYHRLELRGRDDDKERDSIDRRFEVFEQNISSILTILEGKNIPVRKIDGVGTVEEVSERLIGVVKEMTNDKNTD